MACMRSVTPPANSLIDPTNPQFQNHSKASLNWIFEFFHWILSPVSKQIDVSFSWACPVIDHEFGHKIVSQSRLWIHEALFDPRTTLTMLWRNSLSVIGQTHVKNWPQFICLYTITKCSLSLDNVEPRMTLKETLDSISAIIFFRASIWKYKFKSGKCRLDRYVEQIHS